LNDRFHRRLSPAAASPACEGSKGLTIKPAQQNSHHNSPAEARWQQKEKRMPAATRRNVRVR